MLVERSIIVYFKFIIKILRNKPNERPTIKELRDHEFFIDTNWDDVEGKKLTPPISLKLNTLSEDEDCTTVNSVCLLKKPVSNSIGFAEFGQQQRMITDLTIQEEFADLFEDYTSKSFRSINDK